jgi:hypothetical protein
MKLMAGLMAVCVLHCHLSGPAKWSTNAATPFGPKMRSMPFDRTMLCRAPFSELRRLQDELSRRFGTDVTVGEPRPATRSITDRRVLNQEPVVDFVISVAEHVVAIGVVELIGQVVEAYRSAGHLVILDLHDPVKSSEADRPRTASE